MTPDRWTAPTFKLPRDLHTGNGTTKVAHFSATNTQPPLHATRISRRIHCKLPMMRRELRSLWHCRLDLQLKRRCRPNNRHPDAASLHVDESAALGCWAQISAVRSDHAASELPASAMIIYKPLLHGWGMALASRCNYWPDGWVLERRNGHRERPSLGLEITFRRMTTALAPAAAGEAKSGFFPIAHYLRRYGTRRKG